jgi:hypothetical protein
MPVAAGKGFSAKFGTSGCGCQWPRRIRLDAGKADGHGTALRLAILRRTASTTARDLQYGLSQKNGNFELIHVHLIFYTSGNIN